MVMGNFCISSKVMDTGKRRQKKNFDREKIYLSKECLFYAVIIGESL